MNKQLLDDTIAYIRKELTSIHHDLTWADGTQAEAFRVRQIRLQAELDRLEALRRSMIAPMTTVVAVSAVTILPAHPHHEQLQSAWSQDTPAA